MTRTMRTVVLTLILALTSFAIGGFLGGKQAGSAGETFEKALYIEEVEGNIEKAISLYLEILKQFPGNREIAAKAQLQVGLCYEKLGKAEAQRALQLVIENYPDQFEAVKKAREKLSELAGAERTEVKRDSELQIRLVWTGPDADSMAAPSPGGCYLAFMDRESRDLAIHDLITGKNRRLTHNPPEKWGQEFAQIFSWSPDGKSIAYLWRRMPSDMSSPITPPDLLIFNIPKNSSRLLCSGKERHILNIGNWSGDGKKILIALGDQSRGGEIGFISVEDGTYKSMTKFASRYNWLSHSMNLSPDGRFVVINKGNSSEGYDIFVISVTSGEISPLVENPADDRLIGWTPDGEKIIFLSNRTGKTDIWELAVKDGRATGNPTPIRPDVGDIWPLGITPSGSFFYSQSGSLDGLFMVEMDFETGRAVSAAKKISRAFENVQSNHCFSPDGSYLAYIVDRNRGRASRPSTPFLCFYSFKSQEYKESPLASDSLYGPHLEWSDPENVRLISYDRTGEKTVAEVNVQTGKLRVLFKIPQTMKTGEYTLVSKEGRPLFMRKMDVGKQGPKTSVFRVDPASGKETEIFAADVGNLGLFLSPDDNALAIIAETRSFRSKENSRVFLVSSQGGPAKEIFSDSNSNGNFLNAVWAPDSEKILLSREITKLDKTTGRRSLVMGFWLIPINGQPARRLDFETKPSWSFGPIATDGKRISFSLGSDEDSSIWVMENFLPKESRAREKQSG